MTDEKLRVYGRWALAEREAAYRASKAWIDTVHQDQSVGWWMRRYKPEDYKDIVRLLNTARDKHE